MKEETQPKNHVIIFVSLRAPTQTSRPKPCFISFIFRAYLLRVPRRAAVLTSEPVPKPEQVPSALPSKPLVLQQSLLSPSFKLYISFILKTQTTTARGCCPAVAFSLPAS
uniref:Uncharacterized protein n=1 Tax=Panagrellus redivivus TaxID=6233 RepID=A0A7E4ZVL1_PANRE